MKELTTVTSDRGNRNRTNAGSGQDETNARGQSSLDSSVPGTSWGCCRGLAAHAEEQHRTAIWICRQSRINMRANAASGGTVREDYSQDGDASDYFSNDQQRHWTGVLAKFRSSSHLHSANRKYRDRAAVIVTARVT
jgi:hypothetical protein